VVLVVQKRASHGVYIDILAKMSRAEIDWKYCHTDIMPGCDDPRGLSEAPGAAVIPSSPMMRAHRSLRETEKLHGPIALTCGVGKNIRRPTRANSEESSEVALSHDERSR
jgi:hypothetical protein